MIIVGSAIQPTNEIPEKDFDLILKILAKPPLANSLVDVLSRHSHGHTIIPKAPQKKSIPTTIINVNSFKFS